MDFNIKGITFKKEELVSIELESLKIGSLSRHHLFHFFGKEKAFLVLRAGDFIDSSFVTDYLEKGLLELKGIEVAFESDIEKLRTFFESYQCAQTQRELLELRKEFFEIFKELHSGSDKNSFLSFVIFFFEEMYAFSDQILDTYQKTSTILFARTLRISALGVISSLLNNYLDWKYLRDFYNTCFMLDYGLVEYGQFHYSLALACEAERVNPGGGIKELERLKRSEGEKQLFLNHPTISCDFAKEHSENLNYPKLLNIIKIHHEKSDGSGFPTGVNIHEISGFESILTFCDYLVPFNEEIYSFGDFDVVFREHTSELKKLASSYNLPIEKLFVQWSGLLNWLSSETPQRESA